MCIQLYAPGGVPYSLWLMRSVRLHGAAAWPDGQMAGAHDREVSHHGAMSEWAMLMCWGIAQNGRRAVPSHAIAEHDGAQAPMGAAAVRSPLDLVDVRW